MKLIWLLCALAVAAAPAGAYLGEVVASFNTPNLPGAVATSGDYLYVFCAGRFIPPFNYIYQFNAATGSRVRSYASPFGSYTTGLGYEYGGYLWIGRYSPSYVARCDASTGSIYYSFPISQHSLGGGVACQGDPTRPGTLASLITAGGSPSLVTRHRTSGTLLGSFATTRRYFDPAWDYRNGVIWLPAYEPSPRPVYAHTTAGSVVASFRMPTSCYLPGGAAYANNYLYVTNTGNPPYIVYKIHCPSIWQREAATSIGRVKALFR
ncbi:MAG: hypothetical protein JSU81_00940 [Candidatus Coatesbacteria bacterium]|nr:MAG: hypothetical protein JSU81_00940 [Candidatus Coatesbacteria bacterium]